MYTPYNIFYPELPKYVDGDEVKGKRKINPITNAPFKQNDYFVYKGDTYKVESIDPNGYPLSNTKEITGLIDPYIIAYKNSNGTYDPDEYVPPTNSGSSSSGSGTPTNAGKPDPGSYKSGQILKKDGKYYIITGWNSTTGQYDTKLTSDTDFLKGDVRDFTEDYRQLVTVLNDPKVKEALWKEYNKSKTSYTITEGGKNSLKNITNADQLVQAFLKTQKAIFLSAANNTHDELEAGDFDTKDGRTFIKDEYGIDLNDTDIVAFQKVYEDLGDLSIDANIDPDVKTKLEGFQWDAEGDEDPADSRTKGNKKGSGNVSNIDKWLGGNTIQQYIRLKQKDEPTIPDKSKYNSTYTEITSGELKEPPIPRRPAQPWLQDVLRTTNAYKNWADLKKYLPWSPPIDLDVPEYALLDPTWQLQNNQAQYNTFLDSLEKFGTPQSLAANAAAAAGNYMTNAQDILSKYDTANANIQTTGEAAKVGIRNQEALLNAQRAKDSYDATTIADQQFDNAKMKTREEGVKALIDLYTNRGITQAQNLTSAPFQISPETGGFVYFDPRLANELQPSDSDLKQREERIRAIRENPLYKDDDIESIYRIMYPEDYSGYPNSGTSRRKNQRNQRYYNPADYMMQGVYPGIYQNYPGATGGFPWG